MHHDQAVFVGSVVAIDPSADVETEIFVKGDGGVVGRVDGQEHRCSGLFEAGSHQFTSDSGSSAVGVDHDLVQAEFVGVGGEHHQCTGNVSGFRQWFGGLGSTSDQQGGHVTPDSPDVLAIGDEQVGCHGPGNAIKSRDVQVVAVGGRFDDAGHDEALSGAGWEQVDSLSRAENTCWPVSGKVV